MIKMKKYLLDKINCGKTNKAKFKIISDMKQIIDKLYDEYYNKEKTIGNIEKYKETILCKFKDEQKTAKELIKLLKSYEIIELDTDYNDAIYTWTKKKKIKLNKITYIFDSILSDENKDHDRFYMNPEKENDIPLIEYGCGEGCYNYNKLEKEIVKLKLKNVAVDDFINFLIIISDSENIIANEEQRYDSSH
jgi:hypothetical protein